MITNPRHALSVGLAAATLAVVLTYVLGAQAFLQTPYAEPAHNLFMSLVRGIAGGHSSMAQLHGGQAPDSQTQGMSESQMREMDRGILGNNMLGSPAGMAASGLAAVVLMGTTALAIAAFAISGKQRSFVVAGLLAASGIILMTLSIANMNFVIPGPIIGVAVGLGILALGVVKGIASARVAVAAAR